MALTEVGVYNPKEIGLVLRMERARRGIARKDAAQELRVSYSRFSNWEAGISTPSMSFFLEWLRLLGIDMRAEYEGNVSRLAIMANIWEDLEGRGILRHHMGMSQVIQYLQVVRLSRGVSKTRLRIVLGVPYTELAEWEIGTEYPSLTRLFRWLDALECRLVLSGEVDMTFADVALYQAAELPKWRKDV